MAKAKVAKAADKEMKREHWDKKFDKMDGCASDGAFQEDADIVRINSYFLGNIDQYKLQQELLLLKFTSIAYSASYMAYFIDGKRKPETMCLVAINEDNSRNFQHTYHALCLVIVEGKQHFNDVYARLRK